MANSFFKTINNSIKHWYMPLIVGIIFILIGLYTFSSPLESYVALSILFSISFLISGFSEIIFSISNKDKIDSWGWSLTFGIITFVLGNMLILNPAISLTTLPFYVGFLVMFRSISSISFSLELKNFGIKNWKFLMLFAVLGLLFSFILIWNPLFAGITIVVWTGLAFIATGIFSVLISFRLKRLHNAANSIPEKFNQKYNSNRLEIENELKK
ncbi:MAG: DUF308 domain-containing protein [Ignavibacteriales bacterium]|nr:DUF308 domain-containing protein [Ignavibacteriales bacterium]